MKKSLKNGLLILALTTASLASIEAQARCGGCQQYRTSCCNVTTSCCSNVRYYRDYRVYYQPVVTYRPVVYQSRCCGRAGYVPARYYDYYGYRYYNNGFYAY